ncbi:MAG: MaoC family dehydratase N-terminal domain-containing protein [Actinomycetota bacterium]
MPLNKEFIGREFPPNDPYEVTADSIREFADAIGDPNPVYRDEAAAKAAGQPAVIAPPTYLTKLNFLYGPAMLADPALGLNYAMVVHGDQEYTFTRPVRAGDNIVGKPRIGDIVAKGKNEFLITEASIETASGEKIGVARSTIVSRGTAEEG